MKDALGKALWEIYTKGKTDIKFVTHRDDGESEVRDLGKYIQPYDEFEDIQKKALRHAKGKVLDIGVGGGKHSLYLQEKGLEVTGIDTSPYLVKLCRKRGLKDVRLIDMFSMDFKNEKFDTVLLFGNGLSFGGSPEGLKKLLDKIYRITSKNGTILADSTNPKKSKRGLLAYKGKGQFRLRSELNGKFGDWYTPLFISDSRLRKIVKETRWKTTKIYKNKDGDRYSVVLEKLR
jgi:SAM-dependent methyltransferase